MTLSFPTPRHLLTLCLACALSTPALPQVLARPGWAGSGITTDIWWKHAVIYQVDPANFSPGDGTPLHGLTQRLDYIRTLGVDAILLTPIQPDATHAQQLNPALGTLDDLDDLIRESSRRSIRVLLDLDPSIPPSDLTSAARFWLNRGLAGFHISGTTSAAHAQAAELRKATSSYLGQRILIADVDPTLPAIPRRRTYKALDTRQDTQPAELLLDTRLAALDKAAQDKTAQDKPTASTIRPAIDAIQTTFDTSPALPLIATDGPSFTRSMTRYADGRHDIDIDIAKVLATILFTIRGNTLLYYGQELGAPTTPNTTPLIVWDLPVKDARAPQSAAEEPKTPTTPNAALEDADPDSLLNWYRQLITLHHSNATIANGQNITINQDDKNVLVWVRKPQTASALSPPLVILCNLTAQPVQLDLKAEIDRLHLRGSFLRTILRSDKGMGTMHLESMTIAPYSAYIGQLRY